MISSDFLAEKSKNKALSLLKYGARGGIQNLHNVETSHKNFLDREKKYKTYE